MKIIGSLLCIAGVLSMVGQIIRHSSDTPAQNIQGWALAGVMLAIGIPLSQGKLKPSSKAKKK